MAAIKFRKSDSGSGPFEPRVNFSFNEILLLPPPGERPRGIIRASQRASGNRSSQRASHCNNYYVQGVLCS